MTNFPNLQTERLRLSQFTPQDAQAVSEALQDEVFSKNTQSIPHPYTLQDAERFIEHVNQSFAINQLTTVFKITCATTNELVGAIGIHADKDNEKTAELGYWIAKPFWNKGYITEAIEPVVNYGLQQFEIIHASFFEYNPASGRVLEKSSLQQDESYSKIVTKNGEQVQLFGYSISR